MEISSAGVPDYTVPNQLIFSREVESELSNVAQTFWYPRKDVPLPAQPEWIVNTCTDADDFAKAIRVLDETYSGRTPIFNHPRAIMAGRRDIAGVILGDVPGLAVPRCRRFLASAPRSFTDCFDEGGFHFPVTIQRASARNGAGRMVIAGRKALESALLNGGGAGLWHVMVQGSAGAAPPGTMMRIVFAGRTGAAVRVREDGTAPADEGVRFSRDALRSITRSAAGRMPLDLWTLDALILDPENLRLIDVSPGLPVPARSDNLPLLRAMSIDLSRQLGPRILSLIGDRSTWRGQRQSLPSVSSSLRLHGA